jgi:two-component system sensor histidine kinase/response regulator
MMITASPERIVVVDDDHAMRLSCRQILASIGHQVEVFADGAQGLAAVARLRPSLVVVDLKMPGLSGLEVLRRLQEIDASIVVVVITGYATLETAIEAMKSGAYDFLPKPFTPDELRIIVARGLERRRLQRTAEAAEIERELLKRRFLSFVSHQLKTPLAAIHQFLDLLLRFEGQAEVEAKRRDWMERCLERSSEMRRLIDSWLTLSRIEADRLAEAREPIDLGSLLGQLVDAQGERAAAQQVTLALAAPVDSLVLAGDPTCVGVLFENLVDNALKYNHAGGAVTVAASLAQGEVRVEVRDTGPGIAAEALPHLFDEFFRARGARRSGVRGSGLGLAICRRIAHEMGGTIEVTSTPGEGSSFVVRLPAGSGPALVETAAAAEHG